jgi:hypothetical protein
MKFFDNLFKSRTEDTPPVEGDLSLETLLQRSASEAAYRPEFYKRVLSDDLIVITSGAEATEGVKTVQEDTPVNILTLANGVIPVFTAKERIFDKGVITEEVQFMQMAGHALFTMTKGASLVLNPYSDYGKEFLPDEVEQMLNGTILTNSQQEIVYKESTEVLIGAPAKYPDDIVNSLKLLFAGKPRISAAYVAWIHDPATNVPPHYVFWPHGRRCARRGTAEHHQRSRLYGKAASARRRIRRFSGDRQQRRPERLFSQKLRTLLQTTMI